MENRKGQMGAPKEDQPEELARISRGHVISFQGYQVKVGYRTLSYREGDHCFAVDVEHLIGEPNLACLVAFAASAQLDLGSATVPVAPVGVPPTGSNLVAVSPNSVQFQRRNVFGGTPKTAGATPALPFLIAQMRLYPGAGSFSFHE